MKTVAILGASPKEHRYAYKAQRMLMDAGYRVFPVSRSGDSILGIDGYTQLSDISEPVDTLTLYVGPAHLEPMIEDVIALAPRRVIFNPGTESLQAQKAFETAGIVTLEACTLVLVSTNQFETA